MQNVIAAMVFMDALNCYLVRWFLNNTEGLLCTLRVSTNRTEVAFRQAETFLTKGGFRFHRPDRFSETFNVLAIRVQDEHGEPCGGFLSDAGKLAKFLYEARKGGCQLHGFSIT